MRSGPVQADTITFDHLGIDILAGNGRDPFTVMRMTVPPDHGVPSHVSPDEDKLFVVLSGALRFHVGDAFFDVAAGDQLAVGRGDRHGFVNVGSAAATHLIITSPARHDDLLRALAALPDPHAPGAMDDICIRFNQKIIGEARRGAER